MLMQMCNQAVDPKNLFLQSLSRDDRALLGQSLERRNVERGTALFTSDEAPDAIYFPESVIISIERESGLHPHIETAVIGHEGIVGWSALIGESSRAHNAVVQIRSGTVLQISAKDITKACHSSKTLLLAIMCFIEVVMIQMGQAIVSHLRDSVERRICRWLLMRHDRVPSDHLLVNHDVIGANLGMRRASVTDGLHILEGDHLVRCFRGRIIIKDRLGLEARAAESYGVAEDHYRAIIGPFGTSTFFQNRV